ncbi:MAG: hypothetical protein JNJ92_11790 [Altererythrobacter sp.]|nr:hypothetical protein [Altererythrobacter sp.]
MGPLLTSRFDRLTEVIAVTRETKSFPIGRNAKTGFLTTVKYAQSHPKTHVVERMPKPGRGDSK